MDTREADLRAPTHPVTPTDLRTGAHPVTPSARPSYGGGQGGASVPARPAPVTPRSLPERIADAERAVIDHDEALRHGVDRLRDDARQAVRSHTRAAAAVGGGGVLALGLLWWKSRRRTHRHAPVSAIGRYAEARRPRRAVRGPSPLGRLLSRLVPLSLPIITPVATARLRETIGMRATSLVMAVALPAITRAATHLGMPRPVEPAARDGDADERFAGPRTVPLLDLQRYAGEWYEIARLPSVHERECRRDVSTRYVLQGDSLIVTNRCVHEDGSEESITGIAQRPDPAAPGRLKLSFAPSLLRTLAPFTWADYWVLHVDDDYSHAVVGTPEFDHLWLLSRSPRLDDTTFHRLASLAASRGYEVHRLIRTPQTGR